MNFFATIASLENKDGEKIFKIILNDALIFFNQTAHFFTYSLYR